MSEAYDKGREVALAIFTKTNDLGEVWIYGAEMKHESGSTFDQEEFDFLEGMYSFLTENDFENYPSRPRYEV